MKTARNTIALLLCLLVSACGAPANDSDEHNALQALRGQWILVNYWAQWCKPCIEEIPELNAFDAERSDVTVLGVNFEGSTGTELQAQEEALGIAFQTIADPSAALGIARPAVLPTTLLLDPEGNLRQQLLGPQTAATLEHAISAASAAP
ncbi:MAG: TlpA family protein disulfide reductase [Gammaproteobacteria bacterium]|nr:TlpA family protein disulfide reductase [Gammaproteobacteria bacterium]